MTNTCEKNVIAELNDIYGVRGLSQDEADLLRMECANGTPVGLIVSKILAFRSWGTYLAPLKKRYPELSAGDLNVIEALVMDGALKNLNEVCSEVEKIFARETRRAKPSP